MKYITPFSFLIPGSIIAIKTSPTSQETEEQRKMEKFEGLLLLLLLVISVSTSQVPLASAARPLSILPDQQRYSKIFATLGVVCKCCDGTGSDGECSGTWTQPCSQLKCLPWKLH
ncbi:hypothetical protein PTKIN_Ptkin13bG0288600 [Pterospermum kingtungense]